LWELLDYESRLGKPYEHAEYASRLADLRDKLELGLSKKAPEDGRPTAGLAEQIRVLRASVTVEAAPERVTRKMVRAERPVTMNRADLMAGEANPQVAEIMPEAINAQAMAEIVKAEDHDDTPPTKPAGFGASATQRRQGNGVHISLS
jgi:hypothetical protein